VAEVLTGILAEVLTDLTVKVGWLAPKPGISPLAICSPDWHNCFVHCISPVFNTGIYNGIIASYQ
jgi:hypothetical protein